MKSVGEAMAIGRTFKESFQKALRSLEVGRFGYGADGKDIEPDIETIRQMLRTPRAERVFFLRYAFLAGLTVEEIHDLSSIDRWFLEHIRLIVEEEKRLSALPSPLAGTDFRRAKRFGFSDRQIAHLTKSTETDVRNTRKAAGVIPTYRLVDTCAAEFEAVTPYYYSTYGDEDETRASDKKKVLILGGGPNRIGQGIEFDYCCVHAAFALKELGWETIMVNSNPETVSTDYDTSDKLYFEPLTLEDVLNIYEREKADAVIVQFGGQTPLNLAAGLEANGCTIIGTQPRSIEKAEDRKHFSAMLEKLGLRQTQGGTATNEQEALVVASRIGYPVLVRPSFVLGGRAMEIVHDEVNLRRYIRTAVEASPERPVLVDRFLEDATEVDVDCISDGDLCVIGGVMEHIEQAGIHSGDSACVIPTFSLSPTVLETIKSATKAMAIELEVRGLMNVQFAVKDDIVYILEVNPRASRTAPFVSKATGVPLAKLAAKVMAGKTLRELGFTEEVIPSYFSVKEAVFPFIKFPGIDIILGPEMRSTGEVMGIDPDLGIAYAKSQMSAQPALPLKGDVFISVKDSDKPAALEVARDLLELGLKVHASTGTASFFAKNGLRVPVMLKIREGRPNVVDSIKNGQVKFILNTPNGAVPREDEVAIRSAAVAARVPTMTTLRAARASVQAIRAMLKHGYGVKSIQEYHS
jgi:carbamoyl-phosphate synthase large subunit